VRLALGELERLALEFPVEVAITVISLHDPLGGRTDLLRPLQVARGDSLFELLQFLTCSFHRLFTLRLLIAATLVGVDHDHPQVGISRGNFLGSGARRVGLSFPSVGAAGAVDPLRVVDGVEPTVEFGVTPPLDPDEVSMLILRDRLDVRVGDHPPVADEDEPTELETFAQVTDDFLNRGVVDAVARPDVVGDRPARDHHHADDHLHVLRLAVAAVAAPGEVVRARALEIGAGDVVEHQVGLEAEEVAEVTVESHFDLVFGRVELVEGAIPGVELAGMDADPPSSVPVGDEASPFAVADEVGLEPAGEAVLAGGGDEPVGEEHEGAVGERDAFGPPEFLVENGPEAELVEQGADDEDRAPGRGVADLGIGGIGVLVGGVPGEEPPELGEDLDEEVLASEVGDDALLDLTVLAVGLDDADVLVDGAA
jgi:hypothetical protein